MILGLGTRFLLFKVKELGQRGIPTSGSRFHVRVDCLLGDVRRCCHAETEELFPGNVPQDLNCSRRTCPCHRGTYRTNSGSRDLSEQLFRNGLELVTKLPGRRPDFRRDDLID